LIENEKIENLKKHLEKINSLDSEYLKKYYLEILEKGNISDKGGAGLGLIEMARKSGSKLEYDFSPVDEKYSYFYLQTEVPFAKPDENDEKTMESNEINNIKELHSLYNEQNILLNYSGTFNQLKLLKLLSIIERQLKGNVSQKKKVYTIIIELLQNIVNHADNYLSNNVEGNYGFFSIGEKDDSILISSGNYIKNERIQKLKDRIDFLNSLNADELKSFYKDTITNNESVDANHNGLGIIDMRIYSKNTLKYEFHPVDDQYSFYSIQIKVDNPLLASVDLKSKSCCMSK
jgi:ElaB/YqjD/DUF883 family membrane-anchored ribosome-binding protein